MRGRPKPKPMKPSYAFNWLDLDWGLTDEELAEGLGLDAATVRRHRPEGAMPDTADMMRYALPKLPANRTEHTARPARIEFLKTAPLARNCLPPEPEPIPMFEDIPEEEAIYIKACPSPKVEAKLEEKTQAVKPVPAEPAVSEAALPAGRKRSRTAKKKARSTPMVKAELSSEQKAFVKLKAAVRQVADCTIVVRLELPKKLHDAALRAAAEEGQKWPEWMRQTLAAQLEVEPCRQDTP